MLNHRHLCQLINDMSRARNGITHVRAVSTPALYSEGGHDCECALRHLIFIPHGWKEALGEDSKCARCMCLVIQSVPYFTYLTLCVNGENSSLAPLNKQHYSQVERLQLAVSMAI